MILIQPNNGLLYYFSFQFCPSKSYVLLISRNKKISIGMKYHSGVLCQKIMAKLQYYDTELFRTLLPSWQPQVTLPLAKTYVTSFQSSSTTGRNSSSTSRSTCMSVMSPGMSSMLNFGLFHYQKNLRFTKNVIIQKQNQCSRDVLVIATFEHYFLSNDTV